MIYLYCLNSYQGYHYYDAPPLSVAERVQNSKYDLANQLLYNPIVREILSNLHFSFGCRTDQSSAAQLALIKASIIVFLWRLEDRRRIIQWALTGFFIFNLLLAISVFVADLCQCTPVHYYWDKWWMSEWDEEGNITKAGGHCIDAVKFLLISAGLAILTDVMILLIPAAMVWNLRMPRKKKIAVWSVLSLGWM